MQTAIFVSDLHFGARYTSARDDRIELFEKFLKELTGRVSHLFILGDLFEFWMEYRYFIPKAHFSVLAALREVRESGVEVHYMAGNHDFAPGLFFSEQLGLIVHRQPLAIDLQGKRLLLLHGDGLAASDISYRLMKRVITHPFAGFCFRLLHPDLGMNLALRFGSASRSRHDCAPRRMNEYRTAVQTLLKQGHDVIMHGHTHAGFVEQLEGGLWVNSGEWLRRLEYVEMREGMLRLVRYGGLET